MKKETLKTRAEIINNSLYYIYKYIETNITLDELANESKISKFHFHRIFKEETGKNFSEELTSIRLQKAANLLISNSASSITEIAQACGYSSHSSFIKAFKKKFLYTPSAWKKGKYLNYSKEVLKLNNIKTFSLDYKIETTEEIPLVYIRHKGYTKELAHTWQRLKAFALQNNINNYEEYGLLHDNPSITPLSECKYVAAIKVEKNKKYDFSSFFMPKLLCATFHCKGKYGEIIELVRYINQEWVKDKGYEITTMPIFIKYIKNNDLGNEADFEIKIHVPIKVISKF